MTFINRDALASLGQNAHAYAKAYVAIKEALIMEGVGPDEARDAARDAANMAALWVPEAGEPCPMCGK